MKEFPQIYLVTSHTDHVGPGSTFVAIKGYQQDGSIYIPEALKKGASTIVVQKDAVLSTAIKEAIQKADADLVLVPNTRNALAELSAQAHGYPAASLKIIGITGTKGKTTTAYLLEHVVRTAGYTTALLSTVENRIGEHKYAASLTTAQPDYLHTFFAECVKQGVEIVVMEVAAQALTLHRVDTIFFDAIIFANFSHEHLEFYQTLDYYFAAKKQLFSHVKKQSLVVLNADDKRVGSLVQDWPQRETVSLSGAGTYNGTLRDSSVGSFVLDVVGPDRSYQLTSNFLLGSFSGYNCLASIAVAHWLGISKEDIQKSFVSFTGVPGRLAFYSLPNGASALIDTAHSPSSFEALLQTVRQLSSHIIVIFGAGGDRDRDKRPLMGFSAARYADEIILTTDNPRSEDVVHITDEIYAGIPVKHKRKVSIEYDRKQAIIRAYKSSSRGSMILLLGKGPDEYQLIGKTKVPFSERAVLKSLLS